MSVETPTWDKISGGLGSTNKEFGGNWANLISDYYNGINLALLDASKIPIIGTLTRYKFEKLGLFDNDQSHYISFSVDDIDTGTNRKIKFRRMNTPFEEDYAVLEGLPQTVLNKTISASSNTITNIDTSNLAAGTDIITTTNTKTMSNKTLTAPVISTIINGAATLTLPGSTQNILGRTTIDTLQNKTIDTILNTLKNIGIYKYQIFKDGSTYYCRNNQTGAIEVSNASPNTVLAYPITNGGSCYVHGPIDYVLTGSPSVYFDFPLDPVTCEFYMARDAWVVVPQGYTGTVFRLANSTTLHCTGNKLGVNIKEAGTPTLDWIGILMEGTGGTNSRGVYDNHVLYAYLYKPGIGIKYNNATGSTKGFITTNYIDNVTMWTPKTAGIDFVMDETYSTVAPNINGIHRNRHRNILIQGNGSDSTVGVRNIRHKDNSFYGCYVADFTGNSQTSTIHADAVSTIIDGGAMDVTGFGTDTVTPRFVDNSTSQSTKIRSEFSHNRIGRITPGQGGVSMDIIPTGTTNTTSWYNSAVSERFWIRKDGGTNEVYIDSIKQLTGGSLRPIVFRMNDVFGSTVTESFRVDTSAKLQVNTDKLSLLDNAGDHKYNVITSNLAADRSITLPLLAANDIFVFQAFAQTLTNKTMSGASNTFTNIPDSALSANVALLNAANTLTGINTLSNTAIYPIITYRNVNTAAAEVGGIAFNGDPNTGSNVQYAGLIASIVSNTAGAESGQLKFQTKASGALATRMALNNSGVLFVGNSLRVAISETGQTAQHTFTFPDANTTLLGADTSQTVTNKTIVAGSNTITGIVDANITAHTTTKITTTSKSLLNTQIAYKDETAWFTEAMTQSPNIFQLIKLPTWGKKKGGYTANSTQSGWGLMAGSLTALGNFVALDIDTTYGSYVPRATGNVAGNNAGFSFVNALTMRKFNPVLAMLMRPSHISLNRMYLGWKSTAASPTALTDDPLANLSGVMFLQRSGDTTWQICSNSGTATSTIVDTTTSISTTIPTNLQIRADDTNSKWQWSTDGGTNWTDVTGNFPAQTTKLFWVGELQTNEAVIHNLYTYLVEVASDK